MNALTKFLLETRDFFQYAFGDREAVIKRARERNQRAWEKIYKPASRHGAVSLDDLCSSLPPPVNIADMERAIQDSAIDENP